MKPVTSLLQSSRLLGQVRDWVRYLRHSFTTEKPCLHWIHFFIRWSATQLGGMRLMEGMRLRVKDVDLNRQTIIVREAKDSKDRVAMLSRALVPKLRQQMRRHSDVSTTMTYIKMLKVVASDTASPIDRLEPTH